MTACYDLPAVLGDSPPGVILITLGGRRRIVAADGLHRRKPGATLAAMSDLMAGMAIADKVNALELRLAVLESEKLRHELDPGAHAAAFAAHNQSPGAVEAAEDLAQDIVTNAAEVTGDVGAIAEAPVELAADTGEDAADKVEEASEAAVDAIEDATDAALETIEDAVDVVAKTGETIAEVADPGREEVHEREPLRQHPLHKKITLFGKAS